MKISSYLSHVLIALILCFTAASGGYSAAAEGEDSIPQLTEVSAGLYRGGQPTEEGYAQLKTLGVKTVINFRHENDWIEFGRKNAEVNGLNYISIPWTIYGGADWAVAQQFFKVLDDPDSMPVFIYCKRGVERTGVLTAVYYMKYENIEPETAYKKATDGFPVKWIWRPFVRKKFNFFKEKLQNS